MPTYKGFQGLRNDVAAERMGAADLVAARNVDLDNTGMLLRRSGFVVRVAGAAHSLYADGDIALYAKSRSLYRLSPELASTALRADLAADRALAFERVGDLVYYSNGVDTGIVQGGASRTWGIEPPAYQPLAATTAGSLTPGTYRYAMTYRRRDGQESGTGIADCIEIAAGEGIAFIDIPVSADPDVVGAYLYVSPPNGDMLYRTLVLPAGATSAALLVDAPGIVPLATQFLQAAPPGQVLGQHNGRLYVGQDRWLYPSEPYGYELFDLRKWLPFGEPITLIASVAAGLFVGTTARTVFLAGNGPDSFAWSEKSPAGVIPGTRVYVASDLVKGLANYPNEPVPMWLSANGPCVATPTGELIELTQDRYVMAAATTGAAVLRDVGGIKQYLAVMR